MTIATPNPRHTTGHRPWNKGHLIGPKPPLKLPEVWGIRIRLQLEHKPRQLALFNLAIDSKLRGCDLVSLQVRNVIHGSQAVKRAVVIQKKTDRPVQRGGPEGLDSAVSGVFPGCQATNSRFAWSKYTVSGVRRPSPL